MRRMRATVLGLSDEGAGTGADLCAAVAAHPFFHLVAVADRDRTRTEESARRFGAIPYNDFRSAMVEANAPALFLAIPPFLRLEYLRLAAEREMAVLVPGPPAPDLALAVESARDFAAPASLSVARFWQSEPAYLRLQSLEMLIGRVFSAHINLIAPLGDLQGWRGDSQRAGGGVLLNQAYDPCDALVSIFGLPEEVFTILPRTTGPGDLRAHDTEDAATVMLRFPGARVATMNCRRIGREHYWRYRLHGTRGTVLVTPEAMTLQADPSDPPSVSRVRTRNRCSPPVAAFAAALEAGLTKPPSSLEEHLPTMAVIEAAYLSARTGQPESPRRLLHIATGEDS